MKYFNVYSWDGLRFFGSVVVASAGKDEEVKEQALAVAKAKLQQQAIKLTPGMRKVHSNWALNCL